VPAKYPLRVGVTGGIGSGKSEVCRIFGSLGRPVISADELAKQIAEHDPSARHAIRKLFGKQVYTSSGRLNRHALASIIFSDTKSRKSLEAVIHPLVFLEIDKRIDALPEYPYVIIEAALIFESGMDRRLHYTVVVDADEETRIRRVMKRDGATREGIVRRMRAQIDPSDKVRKADFVIHNTKSVASLVNQVYFLDRLFLRVIRDGL
jgi:dephospho-CoA kinase